MHQIKDRNFTTVLSWHLSQLNCPDIYFWPILFWKVMWHKYKNKTHPNGINLRNPKTTKYLVERKKKKHDFIICSARLNLSPWTRWILQQVDCVLIVGHCHVLACSVSSHLWKWSANQYYRSHIYSTKYVGDLWQTHFGKWRRNKSLKKTTAYPLDHTPITHPCTNVRPTSHIYTPA